MRYLVIVLAVVVGFAQVAAAQPAELPYTLTFSGTTAQGTISGDWGGVFVRGAYGGGRWALASGGKNVVEGTYRCVGGCTFDGSVHYATPSRFALYVDGLGDAPATETLSGRVPLDLTPSVLVP